MNKVAKGRKILGMDLTPYSEEGRRLHFENTPIIRLYSAVSYIIIQSNK